MSEPKAPQYQKRVAPHKKLHHHVRKLVQTRKESKAAKLEHMLYPRFLPKVQTKQQEVVAGVVLGLLLLAFLASIVLLGIPGVRSLFVVQTPPSPAKIHTSKPIIAQQTYLQLQLNSWQKTAGGPVFKAYPGFQFVLLDVQIRQKQSVPVWLAPSLQSYVMDQSGQQYSLTPDDEIQKPFPAKEYAPKAVASGQLAYEVPKDAKRLKWCYDLAPGTAESDPLCIELL